MYDLQYSWIFHSGSLITCNTNTIMSNDHGAKKMAEKVNSTYFFHWRFSLYMAKTSSNVSASGDFLLLTMWIFLLDMQMT